MQLSPFVRNAVILGLLSAVGPFAIDMYLPALPAIAEGLSASTAAVQMTLMSFFVAFGVSQLVYGPLSDMIGRKPPLYSGLAIFILGSAGCAFAPSIEWLIFFRFVQGVGASAMMAIPRAIVRDLHTGHEATRLMSLMMLVFSVAPILAPLAGSALIVPFGWRSVFVAVGMVALLGLALVTFALKETRPVEHRVRVGLAGLAVGFGRLLSDLRFLGLTFIGGFGMASFFAFLASSSFIYIDHFGLTPTQYSFAFSVNAIAFIGSSQFAAGLGMRYGMPRVILFAAAGAACSALVLCGLVAAVPESLALLIGGLLVVNAFLGLVVPTSMVLALEEHGPIAGMASALGGTLQMVAGGLMIAVTSVFFDGTALPMVATIALCTGISFTLAALTLRHGRAVVQAAE
jgi:DHA1 family bicyclomycin/chloramphenicol resistance-like MFS transporter